MSYHYTAKGKKRVSLLPKAKFSKRIGDHLDKIERIFRRYKNRLESLNALHGTSSPIEFKSAYEGIEFASKATFLEMVNVWNLILKLDLRFEAEVEKNKLQEAIFTACQLSYCREAIEAFEERIGVAEKRVLNILKGEVERR